MTTIVLDTYTLVVKLKETGLSEQQTAVQVEIMTKLMDLAIEQTRHEYDLNNITTNKDLDARIKETELKIELVRSELKRDIEVVRKEIAETKAELIRWVVGVGILQTTLIAGLLLKLLN